MFRVLIFFVFVYCSSKAVSEVASFGSIDVSEVTSIYDGDTFRANILDWPPIVGQRVSVRVADIDTPELRAKCKDESILARAAKKFTVSKLRRAERVELRNIRRGKYFRLIADVYVDGKSLGKQLVDAGLAVQYSGAKKHDWCK